MRARIIDRMVEKIGPYRVYERLGVGGMGEVYKAYDDRLERWVAIKRIRPDREDAEDNRERFKREARATARLNHPSIVHLYGIFQDGDSDCIVMEYVEGETLDKMLARGPLDPLQVSTLGHEIASGLAEAHANGILHRDLKAENIIITPKGRSKILDFGLAKPILSGELDPVLTGKGQLVGTSRAMSPEYVGGEAIDHRSDLFSLGVLLYECLTGQSPFKAHNTLATLKQVMLHKQTPIREINSDVPKELSDVIDRLLEKDPDDRPQNAQDVSLTFGSLCGQLSSGGFERPSASHLLDSTTSRIKSTARAFSSSETMLDLRPRRRWMTGLAVLSALLAVAFFLGRILDDETPEVTPLPEGEKIQVVLGDFLNQTDESIFDDSLEQAMRVDLEQSRFVETLSPSRVRETLTRMQKPADAQIERNTAIEIARREGAHRVVLGQIQQFGTTYSLNVQVVAPENDVTTFTASESARTHEGILSAIQDLTRAARSHLGESADEITRSTLALEKVTTPNLEALRAYTLGEQRMSRRQFQESIPLFRRAIELDPSFGMAYAKLVVAFSNLGETEEASLAALQAQRHSERLTEEERFYVDGWVARWLGTPQDVIDVWSLFSDLHPEKFVGHSNLALAHWFYRNDFESAAEGFEQAARTARAKRERLQALAALGFCRLALGDFEAAEEAFAAEEEASSEGNEGLILLRAMQGRLDEALAETERLEPPDERTRLLQAVLTSRGDLRRALEVLQENRQRWESEGVEADMPVRIHLLMSEMALAVAAGEAGDMTAAADQVEQLALGSDLYNRNLTEATGPMVAETVKVLARAGRRDRAERLLRQLQPTPLHATPMVRSLVEIAEAEVEIARGEYESANARLRTSLSRTETLTGRESLAYLLERQGDRERAAEEYAWVVQRPGLAFVECYLSCASVSNSLLQWTLAAFRLGELQRDHDDEVARAAYSVFLERWGDAQRPEARLARERLAELGG